MFRELVLDLRGRIDVGKKTAHAGRDGCASAAAPNHIAEERTVAVKDQNGSSRGFTQVLSIDDGANGNLEALRIPHDEDA